MLTVFHSFFLGIILFVVSRFYRGSFPKWSLYVASMLKLVSGMLVGYIYIVHEGGGDTIKYFDEIKTILSSVSSPGEYVRLLFEGDPWYYGQGRTGLFIKLVVPLGYFTAGNYWLISLYLSLFSFLSFWYLVRVIARYYPELKWVAYFAFLLFPSAVFWSSGLLKESVVNSLLAIAVASIIIVDHRRKFDIKSSLTVTLMLVFIFLIKFYLIPALLAGLLWWGLSFFSLKTTSKAGFYIGILLTGFFLLQFLHPWLTPERIPHTIHDNYLKILNKTEDSFTGLMIDPTYGSLLKNTLSGIITAVYRPFIWESGGIFSWEYKLENVALLLLTLVSISRIKSGKWSDLGIAILLFTGFLSLILSFTTPNFGSLYRYKSSFLPYFVLLISVIPFKRYISQTISN